MHVSSTPFLLDSLCTDPLPLRKIGEGALEGRGGLYTGYSWTTGLWHPASRAPRFWPTPERLCMNRGRSCWASDFKGLMWYRQSLYFSSSLKKTKGASACRVGLWEQECLFTMRKGRFYGSVNPRRALPPPFPPCQFSGSCHFVLQIGPMVRPGVHTKQRRIQGRGRVLRTLHQTWRLFETEILTSTGSYITF